MKDDDYEELKSELVKVRQRENALWKKADKPPSGKDTENNTFAYEPPSEYEEIIWKLEHDVWNQIWLQNQLKIHVESTQWWVDELESDNQKLIGDRDLAKQTIEEVK